MEIRQQGKLRILYPTETKMLYDKGDKGLKPFVALANSITEENLDDYFQEMSQQEYDELMREEEKEEDAG